MQTELDMQKSTDTQRIVDVSLCCSNKWTPGQGPVLRTRARTSTMSGKWTSIKTLLGLSSCLTHHTAGTPLTPRTAGIVNCMKRERERESERERERERERWGR